MVRELAGELRLCIEKKSPLLPTIEDILLHLSTAKEFTVCVVKNGFWHIELCEPSSHQTTFVIPFSKNCWVWMPVGINPAPDVFQCKQAWGGLPGIKIVADDILIVGGGDDKEEEMQGHDTQLRQLLNCCWEWTITLNTDKLKLRRTEVPYIRRLLTSEGCWETENHSNNAQIKGSEVIYRNGWLFLHILCTPMEACELLKQLMRYRNDQRPKNRHMEE